MDGKHQDDAPAGVTEGTVKIKIDGVETEVADTVGLHIATLRGRADAAEGFLAKMKAAKEPDGDEGKDEADDKDKEKKQDAADIEKVRTDAIAATRARVALETALAPHLGAEYRCDGKTDAELRADALAKLAPELDLKGRTDAQIEARLEVALEAETTRGTGYEGLRQDAADAGKGNGAGQKSRMDALHDEYMTEVKARQKRERGE